MKKCVLLSIHPKYADAIFKGEKQYEFRKVSFRRPIDKVLVYATSPIKRVIGEFEIAAIYIDSPKNIWIKTNARGGVTEENFEQYFSSSKKAYAIKVKNPILYRTPRLLIEFIDSNIPPQSFCYV